MLEHYGVGERNWRDALAGEPHFAISESPRYVGRAVAHLAADPDVARSNAGAPVQTSARDGPASARLEASVFKEGNLCAEPSAP